MGTLLDDPKVATLVEKRERAAVKAEKQRASAAIKSVGSDLDDYDKMTQGVVRRVLKDLATALK